MSFVLGKDAKIYRNAGTYASPTWTLIPNVMNVTLNLEKGEADVTSRASGGWRERVPTLKDGSVDFEMLWQPGDANFTALQGSFINDTTIEMLILDGLVATPGSQGLRATMAVFDFTRDEQLEDALKVNVSMKPVPADNPPEWFTVPA